MKLGLLHGDVEVANRGRSPFLTIHDVAVANTDGNAIVARHRIRLHRTADDTGFAVQRQAEGLQIAGEEHVLDTGQIRVMHIEGYLGTNGSLEDRTGVNVGVRIAAGITDVGVGRLAN